MRNFPNQPIPLDTHEVYDLAHAGYLPHMLPEDLQPALRKQDSNGGTLLLNLTKKGVSFNKYPSGTLTLNDFLHKNKEGARVIDLALNQTKTTKEAIQTLQHALLALPLKDAEALLHEAKNNGIGQYKFESEEPNKGKQTHPEMEP